MKRIPLILFTLLLMNNLMSQQWITYDTTNSGLINNFVFSVAIDKQGNKWFGTYGGVSEFNGTTWQNYTTKNGLVGNNVTCIAVDKNNNKWIGYGQYGSLGVSKFDGINWTAYNAVNTDSGLANNQVTAINVDKAGNVWFGTVNGISKFNGSAWTKYNVSNSNPYFIYAVCTDSSGNVWFGTKENGVTEFNGTGWTNINATPNGLIDNNISSIAIENNGNKWFGSADSGLSKFDGKNWTTYNDNNSGLSFNNINALAMDAENDIWIGTDGGGISEFNGTLWKNYFIPKTGLSGNTVFAITKDAQNNLWFGTYGGVLELIPCDSTLFTNPKVILDIVTYPDNPINLNAPPGSGYIWQPSTGLNCDSCQSPIATNSQSVTYTVTLTDTFNCPVKEKFIIQIPDCDNYRDTTISATIVPGSSVKLTAYPAVPPALTTWQWLPESLVSKYHSQSTFTKNILQDTVITVTMNYYQCSWTDTFKIINNCKLSPFSFYTGFDSIAYPG